MQDKNRPAHRYQAGVERAVADHGPFGPLEDDGFLVAEGTHNGDRWRVFASTADGTWTVNAESSHNSEGSSRVQGDAEPGDLMVATAEARVATEVVVQRSDGAETPLDLHEVDLPGWPWKGLRGPAAQGHHRRRGPRRPDNAGNVVVDGADELLDTAFDPDTGLDFDS